MRAALLLYGGGTVAGRHHVKTFGSIHSASPRQRRSTSPPQKRPGQRQRELWSCVQDPGRNLDRTSPSVSDQRARPSGERLNPCGRRLEVFLPWLLAKLAETL